MGFGSGIRDLEKAHPGFRSKTAPDPEPWIPDPYPQHCLDRKIQIQIKNGLLMFECLNLLCARMYGSCLDVDKMPSVIKTASQHLQPPLLYTPPPPRPYLCSFYLISFMDCRPITVSGSARFATFPRRGFCLH
jgi:hypothetical protein